MVIPCILVFVILFTVPSRVTSTQDAQIENSSDVVMLERIASADDSEDIENRSLGKSGKEHRTTAYIRLGALATIESLEAARRVESKIRATPMLPATVPLGVWPHPMWHFEDSEIKPLAETRISDGTTFAIVHDNLLGDSNDLFLISSKSPENRNSWTRPILIPNRIYRGIRNPKLTEGKSGHLVFTFVQGEPGGRNIMEGNPLAPPKRAPVLGKQIWDLSLQALRQDSDGDGWTDIEEERLGSNPQSKDTDGDGTPDGEDICPNYAPKTDEGSDEEIQILQKVVLAEYGLTKSRALLLVDPGAKRFQVWGYRGPILYLNNTKEWKTNHPEGGIFVSWKITSRTNSEATVFLSDYEGPLAGSGTELHLHKFGKDWFVTGRGEGFISFWPPPALLRNVYANII